MLPPSWISSKKCRTSGRFPLGIQNLLCSVGRWCLAAPGEAFGALLIAANAGGGNGMLEDQLLESSGFQDDRVLIKRAHSSRKPGAVNQLHSDVLVALKGSVEKRLLNAADRHA